MFRRRIGRQLNRGESVNDLRRHLWVAQRGNVHHRHHDDQTMQAHCHTLLTNACILWTTLYLQDAIDAHRAAGIGLPDDLIARISPACFEHISPWAPTTSTLLASADAPADDHSARSNTTNRALIEGVAGEPIRPCRSMTAPLRGRLRDREGRRPPRRVSGD